MRSVSEAARSLGLAMPVEVFVGTPMTLGSATAMYHGVLDGAHRITLAADAPAAAEWHELQHAVQCERDFGGDSRAMFAAVEARLAEALGVPLDRYSNGLLSSWVAAEWSSGNENGPAYRAYMNEPYEVEARAAERDEPLAW